ncbi:hypothetical protein FACS1894164_19260 [Spirochaetia bacterium]|nr:hypothetical protein FACS1894164_19260 [Spirochaetia bacterium]
MKKLISEKSERLVQLRKNMGMTQEQFVERIGLTRQAISAVERGIAPLTEQNIILICSCFGVSEKWLRTGEGDMFSPLRKPIDQKITESFEQLDPDLQENALAYIDFLLKNQKEIYKGSSEKVMEETGIRLEPKPQPGKMDAGTEYVEKNLAG